MTEQELRQLGILRIPIPIPFAQAGGPVNACIFEEENGLLLFDPGIGTEAGQAALSRGLSEAGYSFRDINRIVLSHGHIDHFGSAPWVLEQIGREIPVRIHAADAEKVLESGEYWPALIRHNTNYLRWLGMPLAVLEETAVKLSGNAGLGRRIAKVTPLIPGEKFCCRHVTLEVLHMPGHTPGLCCLYEGNHKLLFSGDHLLERVSPNPLMDLRADGEVSSFKPLLSYFESLERVRSLPIRMVVPGHAAPFINHLDVIDSLFAFYERRQARVLDLLEVGPRKVYEIMQDLFIGSDGFELILMLSETLANLEVLESQGRAVRETEDGFLRFRVTRNS